MSIKGEAERERFFKEGRSGGREGGGGERSVRVPSGTRRMAAKCWAGAATRFVQTPLDSRACRTPWAAVLRCYSRISFHSVIGRH